MTDKIPAWIVDLWKIGGPAMVARALCLKEPWRLDVAKMSRLIEKTEMG